MHVTVYFYLWHLLVLSSFVVITKFYVFPSKTEKYRPEIFIDWNQSIFLWPAAQNTTQKTLNRQSEYTQKIKSHQIQRFVNKTSDRLQLDNLANDKEYELWKQHQKTSGSSNLNCWGQYMGAGRNSNSEKG